MDRFEPYLTTQTAARCSHYLHVIAETERSAFIRQSTKNASESSFCVGTHGRASNTLISHQGRSAQAVQFKKSNGDFHGTEHRSCLFGAMNAAARFARLTLSYRLAHGGPKCQAYRRFERVSLHGMWLEESANF
jgi:hypothetical protein